MRRFMTCSFVVLVYSGGCVRLEMEQISRKAPEKEVVLNEEYLTHSPLLPPAAPLSQFDPKNPQDKSQTVNWLRSIWRKYDGVKADGNPLQQAEALQHLSAQLEDLRGATIRWKFRVTAMGNDGQRDFLDIAATDSLPTEFHFKTARMNQPAAVARFYMGEELSEETYRKFKKNSPITLEATFGGDLIRHFVVLDNCTIVDT